MIISSRLMVFVLILAVTYGLIKIINRFSRKNDYLLTTTFPKQVNLPKKRERYTRSLWYVRMNSNEVSEFSSGVGIARINLLDEGIAEYELEI